MCQPVKPPPAHLVYEFELSPPPNPSTLEDVRGSSRLHLRCLSSSGVSSTTLGEAAVYQHHDLTDANTVLGPFVRVAIDRNFVREVVYDNVNVAIRDFRQEARNSMQEVLEAVRGLKQRFDKRFDMMEQRLDVMERRMGDIQSVSKKHFHGPFLEVPLVDGRMPWGLSVEEEGRLSKTILPRIETRTDLDNLAESPAALALYYQLYGGTSCNADAKEKISFVKRIVGLSKWNSIEGCSTPIVIETTEEIGSSRH
ncbi:hypothetical protein K435DRAFT_833867, partial [Dendrothele bispora CBS 962.96]